MFSCLGFLTVHANVWYNCQTRYLQVMMVNCNLASSCQYSTYIMGILWTDVKKIAESLQFPDFLIKYVKKKSVFKKTGNIQDRLLPSAMMWEFPFKGKRANHSKAIRRVQNKTCYLQHGTHTHACMETHMVRGADAHTLCSLGAVPTAIKYRPESFQLTNLCPTANWNVSLPVSH